MGLDSIFLEIIESTTPDPNLLLWKFVDADKEIKNGAQLTVRESQTALMLNEGQLADVFGPGLHTLSTENVPILSRLKGWKYGFASPFKADVYFFNTHQFINNKWGTPAPIMLRDPEFGQVRVRAFGSFDIRINDVSTFFRQYAGTYVQLSIFELQNQLRDFLAPHFGEVLARENISVLDVAGNVSLLSQRVEPLIKPYFQQLGLELTRFVITSVSLPDEVAAHYDRMTNMNMVKDMDRFTQFNTANAIAQSNSTANEATQAALMLGLAMNQMNQMQKVAAPTAAVVPPIAAEPSTAVAEDATANVLARLQKLKTLFEAGLIDEAEFKAKKSEILQQL